MYLADTLWRLGEEQKHAREQEPFAPDSRLRHLHEQLKEIAEGLSERKPKKDSSGRDSDADGPASVTSEENMRLRRELHEREQRVRAKLAVEERVPLVGGDHAEAREHRSVQRQLATLQSCVNTTRNAQLAT